MARRKIASPATPQDAGEIRVEYTPLSKVLRWERNPKRHDEPSIDASINRFGFVAPIIMNETTGRLVAGHGRLDSLQRRKAAGESAPERIRVDGGGWLVPVVRGVSFSTDDEAAAYAVADNHIVELGGWDNELLAEILDGLSASDAGLAGIGYTDADLASIHQSLKESDDAGAAANRKIERDEVPEVPTTPVSKNGDLWILGAAGKNGHRIICADSRDKAALVRLMDGKKAQLYSTDPPYGVNYDGTSHPLNAKDKLAGKEPGSNNHDWGVNGDDKYWDHYASMQEYEDMLRDVFATAKVHVADNAAWYTWYADSNVLHNRNAWAANGIRFHQTIQWIKPTPILGFCMFNFQNEPCMMGWVQGDRPLINKIDQMSNVWVYDWEGKGRCTDGVHPTQKPIMLFEIPMLKHTNIGDVCLETFSGSGSQIIAGEVTGRRVFAVERMPNFVDVAVERWQKYTGLEATLEGDGRTFAEVAAERGVDLAQRAADKADAKAAKAKPKKRASGAAQTPTE